MATQVAFSDLNTWLGSQPENTKDTPYEIEVTGLVASNLGNRYTSGTLGNVLYNWRNKFVDLSSTIIPNGVTSLSSAFHSCTNLVKSPVLPNGVINLFSTFWGCESLIEAPIIPNGVTNMNDTFLECSALTSAPVIPDSVIQLEETFSGCIALTFAPKIPSSVTFMWNTFNNCTSLTSAPIIPEGVTDMDCTFYNCPALSYKPIIPNSVTTSIDCYSGVSTPNWKGTRTQVERFFTTETVDSEFQIFADDRTVYLESIYNIDVDNLTEYLESLPDNSETTPYKVYVRNLTTENAGVILTQLCVTMTDNMPRYVDLSLTQIPNGTDMTELFYNAYVGCNVLRIAPKLPTDQTSLIRTFDHCGLDEPPIIPPSYTNIEGAFGWCSSLKRMPDLPSNVVNIKRAFYDTSITSAYIPEGVQNAEQAFGGCDDLTSVSYVASTITNGKQTFSTCLNLVKIDEFKIPLNTLKNNTNFEGIFESCESLIQIGHKVNESAKWHAVRLKFTDDNGDSFVSGKIFSKDKTVVQIPLTQITKDVLTLAIKTDELWFPKSNMSDNNIDAVIEKVLDTRYTYWNKFVIDPNNKSFIMYAEEPNNFLSNINFGGGSSGMPIGSVMAYYGTTDPDGWLICNGRDTTGTDIELETNFPALYAFLGNSNVLPDLRKRFIEGADNDVGTYVAPGIPNITGTTQHVQYMGGASGSGAFSRGDSSSNNSAYNGNTTKTQRLSFNAKNGETKTDGTLKGANDTKVYGESDTVQPASLRLNYIIKAK